MQPSKSALKEELVKLLSDELATLERAQASAQSGATHEEAKPENDKDTRALEQSYLARGQAKRVLELRCDLGEVQAMSIAAHDAGKPIATGALVVIEEGGRRQTLLLAPQGGGRTLANGQVQVVTPPSPLGRALLGKRLADVCEVRVGNRLRELVVAAVV